MADTPAPASPPLEITPLMPEPYPPDPASRQSDSQPVASAPASRPVKRGCLFKGGVAFLVILLLMVVGLGSFCAAFGGQLGQNANLPLETLINLTVNKIQVTDPITETIAIPVPAEVENPRLEIEVVANRFDLSSGDPELLAEGAVSYNVSMLKPKISVNGSTIRLGHEGTASELLLLMVNNFLRNDIMDDWQLRLGTMPMSLLLSTGTAMTNVQLEQYALTDFSITPGAATEYDLAFLAPNAVDMETFEFSSALVKRVNVSGLAHARPRNIRFTADSGEFLLDFSGELRNDIKVQLQGSQGDFTLIIPENIPVQVKNAPPPNKVVLDVPDSWGEQAPDRVAQAGQGQKTIFIEVELEAGTVRLRNQ
jgi:hypothetical protein